MIKTDGDSGSEAGAERRKLFRFGRLHGAVEEIGLHLHEVSVLCRAAVDAKNGQRLARFFLHERCDVGNLEGDGVEHSTHHLGASRRARKTREDAARFTLPIRRTESREGGHEEALIGRICAPREHFRLSGARDESEAVLQPCDSSARVIDVSFKDVMRLALHQPRERGHKPLLASHEACACLHHDGRTRAVGRLRLSGREASLPEESGVRVAKARVDRHLPFENPIDVRHAE